MSAPSTAQALVLAAGRGERMRPLTDSTPKPLLAVQGCPLLQYHLEALAAGGATAAVVNTAWLGTQIQQRFGPRWPAAGGAGLDIAYSDEARDFGGALETLGGIVRALPLLDEVFWLVAGDVFVPGFRFDAALRTQFARSGDLAHLWLVPNPPQHPRGDFGIAAASAAGGLLQGRARHAVPEGETRYTYSTIGLYRRALFTPPWCDIATGNPQGTAAPLAPLLRAAMDQDRIGATLYTGPWADVGTPERLAALNQAQAACVPTG